MTQYGGPKVRPQYPSSTEFLAAAALFILLLVIYSVSRVHQLTDSKYSMLLSQSLYQHGSFTLDGYRLPKKEPQQQLGYTSDGDIYQLQLFDGHTYYSYPIGGAVLSVPFVALLNAGGITATPGGEYDADSEAWLQAYLASFLMAIFGVIVYLTARLMLPFWWALIIALATSLGTEVWSTASRSMWSDTWAVLILGVVIFLLLRSECKKRSLNPILLATFSASLYFVRPTNAVSIAAITIYVLLFHRRIFFIYIVTGLIWLGAFVAFSQYHFGTVLPVYYQGRTMQFEGFWLSLAANLISPSRGLLIYVPVVFFIAYLLVRHWRGISHRRLSVIALAVIVAHWIMVSGVVPGHGGHSYGARYFTGIVPWLALLAVLAVDAWSRSNGRVPLTQGPGRLKVEYAAACLLLFLSVLINGLGATSNRRWRWNDGPPNVDSRPERIWDWSDPQFLPK